MMTNSITAINSSALKYRNLAPKKPTTTEKARVDKLISNHIKVDVICDNALEARGLRLIQPVLRRDTENNSLAYRNNKDTREQSAT
jgi:hypothetical protein